MKRGNRNIKWIEAYCLVPEGRDVGKPVKLRPWQKKIIRGIYDTPTRRAIISFGRKNGKTALSAFLLLLHLVGPEAKPNSQLYSAAQSRDQAAVLYALAAKIIRMSPELSEFVTTRESAKELICSDLGTFYKALSADATTSHGKSPVFVVHDELGQVRGPRSALYEALETGAGAHENPLSIVISTQAPTNDDLMSRLIDDAATGESARIKLFLYTAPLDVDPFSARAQKLANPALGDFLNQREVQEQAETAHRMPASEAAYRNLHLNQRVEVNDPYVSRAVWGSCGGPVASDWGDAEVFAGLDLSSTTDLTAFVMVGWIGDEIHARSEFWLPQQGLAEKARADREPYDLWRQSGNLNTTPGATVNYDQVAPTIIAAMRKYNIQKVAFDRYNMQHFFPSLLRAGATTEEIDRFQEFGQGFKSMTPALRALDEVLLNGRLRHGGHPVLEMCAKNAVVKADETGGNRKLVKLSPTRRIDGMIALAMAVAVAGEPSEAVDVSTPWDRDPDYRMVS